MERMQLLLSYWIKGLCERRVEFRRVGNLGIPCGDMWCTCRGTLRNNKDRSNPHQIQMVPEQAWRAFMHHHAPSSTTVTKSTEFYCISRSICSCFCLWCFDVFFFFRALALRPSDISCFIGNDLRRRQIGQDLPVGWSWLFPKIGSGREESHSGFGLS